MDDAISRQAAIDAIDEQIEQCNKSLSSFDISMKDDYAVKVERASLVAFREILEYLPSAQLGTNLAEVGTDCISREAAINRILATGYADQIKDNLLLILRLLPPAQPEIIRCKDCKHNPKYEWFGCPMSHLSEKQRPETAWCWKAERREVTE